MSACMDFVGNQYLLDQYRKAADLDTKSRILRNLVERLELDGLTHEDALHEVEDAVGADEAAKVALAAAEKRHFRVV